MKVEIRKSNKEVYKHLFCPQGVKYEIRNSNGGLLGGTWNLESAVKIAEEMIEEYRNDELNSHLKIWIDELKEQ